jgi:hypothetical protein
LRLGAFFYTFILSPKKPKAMRKTLFFLLFLLTIQTTFAAALAPQPMTAKLADTKPPKRWIYKERAGVGHVMARVGGVFAGLLLGPIGYFGIRLVTHDEDTRDYAGRGLKLWGFFACIALVSCIAYLTKSNPNSINFLDNWFQDTN